MRVKQLFFLNSWHLSGPQWEKMAHNIFFPTIIVESELISPCSACKTFKFFSLWTDCCNFSLKSFRTFLRQLFAFQCIILKCYLPVQQVFLDRLYFLAYTPHLRCCCNNLVWCPTKQITKSNKCNLKVNSLLVTFFLAKELNKSKHQGDILHMDYFSGVWFRRTHTPV